MACYHPLRFTFQYVSINTEIGEDPDESHIPLHFNMFLLIPIVVTRVRLLLVTLHSNMFLLIRPGCRTLCRD